IHASASPWRLTNRHGEADACMLLLMEKKPPHDESKNRFAEVIRQSQERRTELNNKARKKQMEDIELPPRDEEIADSKEDEEPAI
ncbi:MAG TPA: hypothetical protein VGJ30_07610, partial [Candidatus Angelobacter sp.]